MNLKEAIISVISEQKIATQTQLVEALKQKGVYAEQSTISRQFKKLDVYKTLDNGVVFYKIMQSQGIKDFVKSISHNEVLIVVQTNPGAANMVADYIDKLHLPEIIGTIAGDNTIFVTVNSINNISKAYKNLQEYLIS